MIRRKAIRKALAIWLLVLLAVAGCSNSKDSKSARASEPTSGGELTFAIATSPDTLDPHASGLAVSFRVIKTIFETLVFQGADNKVEPWLATSWDISEDGKTYTFKLREDVSFHDGTKFNAEAVKYNFDRIFDPETKAATPVAYMDKVKSVEAVDEHTVKITLSEPSATFLTLLAHTNLSIVSPETAKKGQFASNPVGTGPFKFVEQVENDRVVLERFDDYHGHFAAAKHEGKAYLDKLTFKIIPEEATRIGSVQSSQVDSAETVPPQDILSIQKGGQLNIHEAATGGLPYTLFINNTNEPWNDPEARQALRAAVDVETIVKTLYLGTYKRSWSSLAPITFGYDTTLENKNYFDLKKANEQFDQLGWKKEADGFRKKDGKTLTLRIFDHAVNREKRQDISLMVQQQLKAAGVKVELNTTNDLKSIEKDPKSYDLRGNSRVALDPDDLRRFYSSKHSLDKGGINLGWVNNKKLDELLEQGAVEADQGKRASIYKEIQQEIDKQAYIIPIYDFPYTVAAGKQVEGLSFDSLGYPLFYDVHIKK